MRSIYLGENWVFQHVVLQAYSQAIAVEFSHRPVNLAQLSIRELLQSGADELLISKSSSDLVDTGAIKKRIKKVDTDLQVVRDIEYTFSPFTRELSEVMNLKGLIKDLAVAREHGCAVLLPPLARREILSALPPELAVPSRIFLDSLAEIDMPVALPAKKVSRRDLSMLLDLLSEKEYRDYSVAHAELDDASNRLERVVGHITDRRDKLVSKAGGLLEASKVRTSLVDGAKKIATAALDKPHGAVADVLLMVLVEVLERRQRIVLYHPNGISLFFELVRLMSSGAKGVLADPIKNKEVIEKFSENDLRALAGVEKLLEGLPDGLILPEKKG